VYNNCAVIITKDAASVCVVCWYMWNWNGVRHP